MFFTNEKKQEIRNKDKGVVSMILPDSKMKPDECVRHDDVEIIPSPLGAITRDAVSDSEVAKVLNRCKYEDTVDYD